MTMVLLALGGAFVATVCLTPLVRHLAIKLDIVDRPDGRRKLHSRITPLGGGVAVFGGTLIVGLAIYAIPSSWQQSLIDESHFVGHFAAAGGIICLVGLLDDRFNMRGRQKLLGQLAAASLLAASGLVIETIHIAEWRIELGPLAYPFTLFWLLGAINALNLIDGIDGLATSVGLILSLSLAAMAFMTGHPADGIIAIVFAGALCGFLVYNFPPAQMFLGDAGSMLIGLTLGALAIRSSLKGPATVALAAPTALWAIPILDVAMAILRRKLTGRSIYATDRGHLHHCLLRRGFSSVKTLMAIGGLCALTAAGALISVAQRNEYLALGAVAAVIGTLIVSGYFGHAECVLLFRRIKHLVRSIIPRWITRNDPPALCTHIEGTRQWDGLWRTLADFADRFDLCSVQLNVTLPAISEEYHATWERRPGSDSPDAWSTDLPLVSGCTVIGRLRISGSCRGDSICRCMAEIIADLKAFENQLLLLLENPAVVEGAIRGPVPAPNFLSRNPGTAGAPGAGS